MSAGVMAETMHALARDVLFAIYHRGLRKGLPIVWLRTAVAMILYVLFPRLSLNLKKLALKFKQLRVYYAMIAGNL